VRTYVGHSNNTEITKIIAHAQRRTTIRQHHTTMQLNSASVDALMWHLTATTDDFNILRTVLLGAVKSGSLAAWFFKPCLVDQHHIVAPINSLFDAHAIHSSQQVQKTLIQFELDPKTNRFNVGYLTLVQGSVTNCRSSCKLGKVVSCNRVLVSSVTYVIFAHSLCKLWCNNTGGITSKYPDSDVKCSTFRVVIAFHSGNETSSSSGPPSACMSCRHQHRTVTSIYVCHESSQLVLAALASAVLSHMRTCGEY